MRRIRFATGAVLLLVAGLLGAQSPASGLRIVPALTVAVGEDAELLSTGGQASVLLYRRLPFARRVQPGFAVGYGINGLNFETSLSVLSGGGSLGFVVSESERSALELIASGGYFYGFLNNGMDPKSGGGFYDAGAVADFILGPGFSITASASYRSYLGLAHMIAVGLGGRVTLGADPEVRQSPETMPTPQPLAAPPRPIEAAANAAVLRVHNPHIEEIFPVFFKYYDEHPIGSAELHNASDSQITNLSVSFRAGRYMDNATACRAPDEIAPGQRVDVEILGFFNESVLEITEATKVSAELVLAFTRDGQEFSRTYTQTVRLHDRNSMTWDDDRKPAAYVTARDPSVMTIAKLVSAVTTDGPQSPVPVALRTAMALHTAVGLYGMTYTPDPESAFRNRDPESLALDYLQFPRQTLEYRGGDCDDLSILYAALLQALGVRSAFVLVPGHIFLAVDIGLSQEEALRQLPRADELVFRNNTTWIPLEVTMQNAGFLDAWQTGARQWREATARDQAGFFTLAEAWDVYEPVGLLGQGQPLTLPATATIASAYERELTSFIDQTIFPMIAELERRARESSDPIPFRNRLAVLYGRYGLYERAETALRSLLAEREGYLPALINLAHVHVATDRTLEALDLYEQALARDPENPHVLISVAQIHHDLENYGLASRHLDQAREIDPALAGRYSYLEMSGSDTARASDVADLRSTILWEEEE